MNWAITSVCQDSVGVLGVMWDVRTWTSVVTSLPIDLGLETDATEDDFGVWEVKTMVAVILHLLERPNSKVLALLVSYCQGWVNASEPSCRLVTFSKRTQGGNSPPHPLTCTIFAELGGETSSTRPC